MISEDLDLYFADFGVPITWERGVDDVVESKALFDMPDEINEGTLSISTAYAVTVRTDLFGAISKGSTVIVDGIEYTVGLSPLKLSDGRLCVLGLDLND